MPDSTAKVRFFVPAAQVSSRIHLTTSSPVIEDSFHAPKYGSICLETRTCEPWPLRASSSLRSPQETARQRLQRLVPRHHRKQGREPCHRQGSATPPKVVQPLVTFLPRNPRSASLSFRLRAIARFKFVVCVWSAVQVLEQHHPK